MHFSIPTSEEFQEKDGSPYLVSICFLYDSASLIFLFVHVCLTESSNLHLLFNFQH